MTIEQKIKACLSMTEAFRKELLSFEQMCAELAALQGKIDAAKAELAQLENDIERTRRMAGEADAQHSAFSEASTRERVRCNTEIDKLQQQLTELNAQVKEKRWEVDNVTQGLKALKQRLEV
jgi:peptidoglycan hydrolase CwlO-like protein